MSERMTKFSYDGAPPPEYVCGECKASGVRLYRDYNTFADATRLLCTACAEQAGSTPRKVDPECPDQCGWMVAAVPTEDGSSFWGFSSVPWRGVYWWRSLPTTAGHPQPAEYLRSWLCQQVENAMRLVEFYSKSLGKARASEVELTQRLAEKDATIKALADALERTCAAHGMRGHHRHGCDCIGCAATNALHLAGRL